MSAFCLHAAILASLVHIASTQASLTLEERIKALEAENAKLRAGAGVAATQAPANELSAADKDDSAKSATEEEMFTSIPLQKQYVPVMVDGKVIAYKAAYFGTVSVGTPASQFTVVFDTGSGNFILPSMQCTSETCHKHRRYDRLTSASAVDVEYDGTKIAADATERDQVTVAFGTGEIQGEFVEDAVCFGVERQHCATARMILAAEMTDDPFGMFEFDGVLGLGLKALTLAPEFSIISQMLQAHKTMKPQFAVYLGRYDGDESAISFGGYDPSRFVSTVKWAPVWRPELGYWQVQIKRIRMGDVVLEECETGGCRAIFDTGTSLLGVPRAFTRTMHRGLARLLPQDVPTEDAANVDCRTVPGRSIQVDLGEQVISLGVEDYSRPAPSNVTMPRKDGVAGWKMFCRSILLPVDPMEPIGSKVFIFGEPVLRRYYTVYDVEKKQIGFAAAAPARQEGGGMPVIGAPPAGSQVAGVGSPLPASARTSGEVRV